MKILRKNELIKKVGLSGSTIWRYERDGTFPRRFKLGKRTVGWDADEVEAWFEEKKAISSTNGS